MVCSNDTGLSKNELTKSLVRPKSEEIEQKVEEEDEVQIIPTEKEALDNGKDEPRMEEYETELQVEELGKPLYSALLSLPLGYHIHQ